MTITDEDVKPSQMITPYSDEDFADRMYRLDYAILEPGFWEELNDWRAEALERSTFR